MQWFFASCLLKKYANDVSNYIHAQNCKMSLTDAHVNVRGRVCTYGCISVCLRENVCGRVCMCAFAHIFFYIQTLKDDILQKTRGKESCWGTVCCTLSFYVRSTINICSSLLEVSAFYNINTKLNWKAFTYIPIRLEIMFYCKSWWEITKHFIGN